MTLKRPALAALAAGLLAGVLLASPFAGLGWGALAVAGLVIITRKESKP